MFALLLLFWKQYVFGSLCLESSSPHGQTPALLPSACSSWTDFTPLFPPGWTTVSPPSPESLNFHPCEAAHLN